MIKITAIKIQRFRSILNLDLNVDDPSNIITICGQNNVGKTNVLRALNLFFNPDQYEQKNDIPTIKVATGGGSIHPKIQLTIYDDKEKISYEIARDFGAKEDRILSGKSIAGNGSKKKIEMTGDQIDQILSKIEFIFIPSINTNMPELIELITQDMLDIQYDRARFSQSKATLKKSYDEYVDGLNIILNDFSNEISSTFQKFKDDWKIEIKIPNTANTFRALISDKASLTIQDRGHQGVEDKGSGLQRLAHILLQFEVLERLVSKKSVIICIDEPDIYLHEGLQRKLVEFIKKKSEKMQILYTTHSRIFIDAYHLDNTVLLSASIKTQYSARKKKHIDVIETQAIDISRQDGFNEICEYLGLEDTKQEVLSQYTILTEGETDKKYLTELGRYFGCSSCDIISAEGADNIPARLNFYNSMSQDTPYVPCVKILLDNDSKGREIYNKITQILSKENRLGNLSIKPILIRNYIDNSNIHSSSKDINNEIEDLLYPELITYLINLCLKKTKKYELIDEESVCKKIGKAGYASKGILDLCEHHKLDKNPDLPAVYPLDSPTAKRQMAEELRIEGNYKVIQLLKKCEIKYPYVKEFVCELFDFSEMSGEMS